MKLMKSFKYALGGIWNAIINEMNFRIHTVAAISVVMFAAVYKVTSLQAAILTLIICLVMAMELLNTVAEAIVDLISPNRCRMAQIAKDSAAAAVLILAIGAVIIAIFTFSDVERLKNVWKFALDNIAFFTVYIIACVFYIFGIKPTKKRKD